MYKSVYISDRITLEESGMYHVQDMHDMGTLLISRIHATQIAILERPMRF